jgi:hypothetical protein
MRLPLVLSTSMMLAALAVPAAAEQEFRAGGLVFKEGAPEVSILEEDVYLSAREVRVHYAYEFGGESPKTVTMGFRLPQVPLEGGPDYMGGALGELDDPRNTLQFTATAGGQPIDMTLSERAFLNGFDVTDELLDVGMPPFLPAEAKANFLEGLDEAARQALVDKGFFLATEEGFEFWEPLWDYEASYQWEQPFEPGKTTEIDIRYVPLNGYHADIGMAYEGGDPAEEGVAPDAYYEPGIRAEYCIDQGLVDAVRKRRDAGKTYEVVTQGFALAAPGNENIGRFTLTVDKADPEMGGAFELVSFCPLAVEKVSDTAFRWAADYFTPNRDVAVVYYAFQ